MGRAFGADNVERKDGELSVRSQTINVVEARRRASAGSQGFDVLKGRACAGARGSYSGDGSIVDPSQRERHLSVATSLSAVDDNIWTERP